MYSSSRNKKKQKLNPAEANSEANLRRNDKIFTKQYRGKLKLADDVSLASLDSSNHFNQLMNELQKGRKLHLTPKPNVNGPLSPLGIIHYETRQSQSIVGRGKRFLWLVLLFFFFCGVGGALLYTFATVSGTSTGRSVLNSDTYVPTISPTTTMVPTLIPTTMNPTKQPTLPTNEPTSLPTFVPTKFPTKIPTEAPTVFPTNFPTPPTPSPTWYPFADPCSLAFGSSTKFCYDDETLGFCDEVRTSEGIISYVRSDRVKICPEEEEERISCRCPDGLPFTFTFGCAFPRNVNTFCATSSQSQAEEAQFLLNEYG